MDGVSKEEKKRLWAAYKEIHLTPAAVWEALYEYTNFGQEKIEEAFNDGPRYDSEEEFDEQERMEWRVKPCRTPREDTD